MNLTELEAIAGTSKKELRAERKLAIRDFLQFGRDTSRSAWNLSFEDPIEHAKRYRLQLDAVLDGLARSLESIPTDATAEEVFERLVPVWAIALRKTMSYNRYVSLWKHYIYKMQDIYREPTHENYKAVVLLKLKFIHALAMGDYFMGLEQKIFEILPDVRQSPAKALEGLIDWRVKHCVDAALPITLFTLETLGNHVAAHNLLKGVARAGIRPDKNPPLLYALRSAYTTPNKGLVAELPLAVNEARRLARPLNPRRLATETAKVIANAIRDGQPEVVEIMKNKKRTRYDLISRDSDGVNGGTIDSPDDRSSAEMDLIDDSDALDDVLTRANLTPSEWKAYYNYEALQKPYKEIAKMMGVQIGSVSTFISRARKSIDDARSNQLKA